MITEKRTARITGVLYLIIFFANVFAYFFVGKTLSEPGNATVTAKTSWPPNRSSTRG